MSKKSNLYLGRAGQLAVMAEFLARGWNVAIPEVDVGDDIFVVRDSDGNLSRIQVKAATAKERKDGYSAQFSVRVSQLALPMTPDLTYVFVVRRNFRWESFLVIGRERLNAEYEINKVGSRTNDQIVFYFSYRRGQIAANGRDFTELLSDWSKWPLIVH
ncbi:MAG: hypothetical protein ACHQ4J_03825 [Candidatus Binatia bacterium]